MNRDTQNFCRGENARTAANRGSRAAATLPWSLRRPFSTVGLPPRPATGALVPTAPKPTGPQPPPPPFPTAAVFAVIGAGMPADVTTMSPGTRKR
jgi:hypothetical protein